MLMYVWCLCLQGGGGPGQNGTSNLAPQGWGNAYQQWNQGHPNDPSECPVCVLGFDPTTSLANKNSDPGLTCPYSDLTSPPQPSRPQMPTLPPGPPITPSTTATARTRMPRTAAHPPHSHSPTPRSTPLLHRPVSGRLA